MAKVDNSNEKNVVSSLTTIFKVDNAFIKRFEPHQLDGLLFMLKALFEANSGCILAHSMGLGKTAQAVALIHTAANHQSINRILVVCPKSFFSGWENEFSKSHRITQKYQFVLGKWNFKKSC